MPRLMMAALIPVVLVACQEVEPAVSVVSPGVLQVTNGQGVSLEVLEWGGTGTPLVLLGGGGATAHIYDEFAPLLTDDFRVFGITRRGIGASADIPPNDFRDLVEDIVDVLDALDLRSAVLVGHSLAGFEMTRFAERYGERCAGLVYLDAAYDYALSDVGSVYQETPPPDPPPMLRADSASVEAVQSWFRRTQGFAPPESELRATGGFDLDGRYQGRTPPSSTAQSIAMLRRPGVALDAVQCASLGLFPVPGTLALWHPSYEAWTADEQQQGNDWQEAYRRWVQETRDNFDRYPNAEALEFPNSGHMFFLSNPEEVAGAVREFVLRPK